MQRLIANVAYADGRVESISVSPKVQMLYERKYKTSLGRIAETGITGAFQLAYEAMVAKNHGEVVKLLEDWIEDVEAVELSSEEIRPTKPAALAGASRNSASSRA